MTSEIERSGESEADKFIKELEGYKAKIQSAKKAANRADDVQLGTELDRCQISIGSLIGTIESYDGLPPGFLAEKDRLIARAEIALNKTPKKSGGGTFNRPV
jgi:hypothetical protein